MANKFKAMQIYTSRRIHIYKNRLTSCPRQLAKQYAVSIDQIFTSRSSEPVITYLPARSNIAVEYMLS